MISTRLLAGAIFLQRLAQLAHGHGVAEQFRIGAGAALQILVLAPQPRGFERAADDQNQPVGIERFFDIVIGAALDRRDRGFDVAVAGNDDDRQFGMPLRMTVQEIEPVELRALQPDVENDQRRPAVGERRERGVAVVRQPGFVALVLQNAGDQFADVGFIINNQNISSHCIPRTSSRQRLRFAGIGQKCSETRAPRPPRIRRRIIKQRCGRDVLP